MSGRAIKECPSCGNNSFYVDGAFVAEAHAFDGGIDWKFSPVATHDGAEQGYICRCQNCGNMSHETSKDLFLKEVEDIYEEEPDLDVLQYDSELAYDLLLEAQERDSIDDSGDERHHDLPADFD